MASTRAAQFPDAVALGHASEWARTLSTLFARVALFYVDGTAAQLAAAFGMQPSSTTPSLSLIDPTPLRWTLEAAAPVVGAGRAPGGACVATHLGVSIPRSYAVLPFVVEGQLLALAYVDQADAPLPMLELSNLLRAMGEPGGADASSPMPGPAAEPARAWAKTQARPRRMATRRMRRNAPGAGATGLEPSHAPDETAAGKAPPTNARPPTAAGAAAPAQGGLGEPTPRPRPVLTLAPEPQPAGRSATEAKHTPQDEAARLAAEVAKSLAARAAVAEAALRLDAAVRGTQQHGAPTTAQHPESAQPMPRTKVGGTAPAPAPRRGGEAQHAPFGNPTQPPPGMGAAAAAARGAQGSQGSQAAAQIAPPAQAGEDPKTRTGKNAPVAQPTDEEWVTHTVDLRRPGLWDAPATPYPGGGCAGPPGIWDDPPAATASRPLHPVQQHAAAVARLAEQQRAETARTAERQKAAAQHFAEQQRTAEAARAAAQQNLAAAARLAAQRATDAARAEAAARVAEERAAHAAHVAAQERAAEAARVAIEVAQDAERRAQQERAEQAERARIALQRAEAAEAERRLAQQQAEAAVRAEERALTAALRERAQQAERAQIAALQQAAEAEAEQLLALQRAEAAARAEAERLAAEPPAADPPGHTPANQGGESDSRGEDSHWQAPANRGHGDAAANDRGSHNAEETHGQGTANNTGPHTPEARHDPSETKCRDPAPASHDAPGQAAAALHADLRLQDLDSPADGPTTTEPSLAAAAAAPISSPGHPWLTSLLIGTLALLLAGAAVLGAIRPIRDPLAPTQGPAEVQIEVPPSARLPHMARLLAEAKLIRQERLFILLARLLRIDRHLRAGIYRVPTGLWPWQVLEILHHGQLQIIRVTIPEGLTLRETAALLARQGLVRAEDFITAARDPALLKRYSIDGNTAEGFLFPETYRVVRGVSARDMVSAMVWQFFHRLSQMPAAHGLSPQALYDRVILASLVEREARVRDELPRVAGVFANRLAKSMRLESCASVQYLLGHPKEHLQLQDVRIPSPYNTYLHPGLPPSPIANAGALALSAALQPEDHDYLFFFARTDGSHRHEFSRSFSEHQKLRSQLGAR